MDNPYYIKVYKYSIKVAYIQHRKGVSHLDKQIRITIPDHALKKIGVADMKARSEYILKALEFYWKGGGNGAVSVNNCRDSGPIRWSLPTVGSMVPHKGTSRQGMAGD